MKLPIETWRHVLQLICETDYSNRKIGHLVGVSPNTVRATRGVLTFSGQKWEELKSLDNDTLYARLFPQTPASSKRPLPDWSMVHAELQKRDVTLELLWNEYRGEEPNGVSYTQFTRLYRKWRRQCKLSLRFVYHPGEMLFVDFCGKTMPVRTEHGDLQAQIFVGTLGASGYIYAIAVASQTIEDWLFAQSCMLEHLGGVPKFIVPDNLKSAVTKHTRHEIILNQAYREWAEHYGVIIVPARPRQPQDKSLAEIGVQIVQRWVLARLRHQVFFSLEELNRQLTYWMEQLNNRATRTYPTSRMTRLSELDLPALGALPQTGYPYSQWRYQVRVDEHYHVRFGEHYYSVPYTLVHQLVDLRASNEQLDIYLQRRQIASHRLQVGPGLSTHPAHRPPHHQYHLSDTPDALREWAQDYGPATLAFVSKHLEERRDFANGLKSIRALRRDVRKEGWSERLEAACHYALTRNILTYDRLRSIMKKELYRREPEACANPPMHENLRGAAYFASKSQETSSC